jgi:hypothetical protein
MNDWQPIETAPKDGTVILIHHNKKEIETIYPARWLEDLHPEYPWQVLCSFYGENFLPDVYIRRWMPLPEPPYLQY